MGKSLFAMFYLGQCMYAFWICSVLLDENVYQTILSLDVLSCVLKKCLGGHFFLCVFESVLLNVRWFLFSILSMNDCSSCVHFLNIRIFMANHEFIAYQPPCNSLLKEWLSLVSTWNYGIKLFWSKINWSEVSSSSGQHLFLEICPNFLKT